MDISAAPSTSTLGGGSETASGAPSATTLNQDDTQPTVTEWETAHDSVVSLPVRGQAKPCKGCDKEEAAIKFREKLIIALSALFVLLFAIDVALVVRVTSGCKGGLLSFWDNGEKNQTEDGCNIVTVDENATLLPPAKTYLQLGEKAEYKCKIPYKPLSPNGTVVCNSKKDFNLSCENECEDGDYYESKKVCVWRFDKDGDKFSKVNWAEALEACEARGPDWTLNMPKTQEEDDWAHKDLRRKFGPRGGPPYIYQWMGLRYSVKEGTWVWVDGTKVKWTNWHDHEASRPIEKEGYCATTYNHGYWFTMACTSLKATSYACQREYGP